MIFFHFTVKGREGLAMLAHLYQPSLCLPMPNNAQQSVLYIASFFCASGRLRPFTEPFGPDCVLFPYGAIRVRETRPRWDRLCGIDGLGIPFGTLGPGLSRGYNLWKYSNTFPYFIYWFSTNADVETQATERSAQLEKKKSPNLMSHTHNPILRGYSSVCSYLTKYMMTYSLPFSINFTWKQCA